MFLDDHSRHVLFNLIADSHSSYDSIRKLFLNQFSNVLFRAGCTLCMLTKEPSCTINQRIIAFELLYDCFAKQCRNQMAINNNPFIPFIISYVESLKDSDVLMQRFLSSLLVTSPGYIENLPAEKTLRKSESDFKVSISWNGQSTDISVDNITIEQIKRLQYNSIGGGSGLGESVFASYFGDTLMNATALDGQDNQNANSNGKVSVSTVDLWKTALNTPLAVSQQNSLTREIRENPSFLIHVDALSTKLKDLIEYNPTVAVEILYFIIGGPPNVLDQDRPATKTAQFAHLNPQEFLDVIINMEMSLRSLEVVNRLSALTPLPIEFYNVYISKCIATCEGMKDKNTLQSRLVRLVCVFIHSLLRNKIFSAQDLLAEVESFSVRYSKIKEAASLFKFIKDECNGTS